MSFAQSPTFAGFNDFVYSVMMIPELALPSGSPVINIAFQSANLAVNQMLVFGNNTDFSPITLATYNLGGSNLINYAQDQPGRTYFKDLRESLGINKFAPGVVSSTGDSGTSTSLLNPEFMKTLTLANLQQIKDPWGRAYLMIAQDYGPTIWGLS